MGTAPWRISGSYLEACNCQAICPCRRIGGRPGGLGWRHFAAAMRRCQRSSVPGVTIRRARSAFGRTRASAASTARSVQDRCGLGVARRSTATSCRSASISASLDEEDRARSANHDTTVTSSR